MSRTLAEGDGSGVVKKIADAAMNIHGLGSRMAVDDSLEQALRNHLSTLIDQGMRDSQTLLDRGIAFLRLHETHKRL